MAVDNAEGDVGVEGKGRKLTKNEIKRARKRRQKEELRQQDKDTAESTQKEGAPAPNATNGIPSTKQDAAQTEVRDEPSPRVELVEAAELPLDDPMYAMFSGVFDRFQAQEAAADEKKDDEAAEQAQKQKKVFFDDMDNIQDEDEERETMNRLDEASKRKRKQASKLSVAELKAIVPKPEMVEWHDTDASDPQFLLSMKSARNAVPVPKHWSLKREYLSSKRGIQKPAYKLPSFIAETGISEMRDAVLEKQAQASLKQQQRARVQPKMGKLDLDYHKMYEAFFRRQTKPPLTPFGEVYYEGKEYETNLRHLRPGELSDELREALNMPPGAPPPWLINQQKVGPPPSYPALKIPGLNAPPPPGASWGFQPGGYGKPPVDADNKPLYGGDIFGMGDIVNSKQSHKDDQVDRTPWGTLGAIADEQEEEEASEDEEEDEEEEEDEPAADAGRPGAGMATPFAGIATPGIFTSTAATDANRAATSQDFKLRKDRPGIETEETSHPRTAGTVLQERSIRAEGFFGGERAYDLGGGRRGAPPVLGSEQAEPRGTKRRLGDMDVSVDVDALERDDRLSKEQIQKQYDTQHAQQGRGGWQGAAVDDDDLSQMIAEEASKRLKKDQERQRTRGGGHR